MGLTGVEFEEAGEGPQPRKANLQKTESLPSPLQDKFPRR